MWSIRYKFPLILMAVITLFGLASSWVSNHVIMPPFLEMDRQRVGKNMQRNINALLVKIEEVERITMDWAMWDDSYGFIQGGNSDFIPANINKETYKNIKIDIMLFLDLEGKMVFGAFYDHRMSVLVSPKQEGTRIQFGNFSIDLARMRVAAENASGLYLADNHPLMYASAVMRDTDGEEAPKGRFIMARLLTEKMVEELRYQTESSFAVAPLQGGSPTAQQQQLIQSLATSGQSILLEQGEDLVSHNVIPTTDGGHLLISVQEKKSFAALAKTLIDQVIAWLVIGGMIIFFVSITLIRLFVVTPVLKIAQHVKTVNETHDYTLRLNATEKDEIGELSRNMDGFVATLSEKYHGAQSSEPIATGGIKERKSLEYELQTANEKLRRLASSDGLTGLANRRIFDEHLLAEWRRMQRHGRHLTLMMLDIDHFKLYNDTYGHTKGDQCLQDIARALKYLFKRSDDLVARYGGEEFAIILAECTPEMATKLGEELISCVSRLYIEHSRTEEGMVTGSVGVCTVTPSANFSHRDLLKQADENLYKAKATGRNQAWVTVLGDCLPFESSVLEQEMVNQQRQ